MTKLTRFHLFAALTCAYAVFLFYLSSLSSLPGLSELGFLYGLVDALKNAGLEMLVYPFYLAYLYPDKVAHILLYLGLGLLLHVLFRSSEYEPLSTRPALFAVLFGVLYSVTDELHQYFVPGRSMSALDLGADLTGLLLAQLLIFLVVGFRQFLKTKRKLEFSNDLLMVLLFDFLAYLFVLVQPFNQTPLRIVFALPLLLFLPGYVLIAAMFPRKVELSSIERFTLSIGLSIAIFVFDGFAISVTPWRFRPAPIIYSLSLITITLTMITLLVRAGIPAQERYSFDLAAVKRFRESLQTDEKPSDIERALIIALVGSIIIASGMLIYAKVTFEEEKFTALYILGEGGKAENYSTEVHLLEPSSIIVGIENYEHAPANYTLQVMLGGYPLHEEQITLAHGEKWEDVVQFTPRHVAKHAKLEFLLYKDGSTSLYRSVHLWVDSLINYGDLTALRSHTLMELPVIMNPDMELDANWTYTASTWYFRGHLTKFYNVEENVTVSGYLTDNTTGAAIGNARVYVTNRYGYEKTNVTDERGYYELHLIPDYFWLDTTAQEYRKAEAEFNLAGGEPRVVNLRLDPILVHNLTIEELSRINETIPLLPPESLPEAVSTVNGYIYDTVTGLPVVNASVIVRNEYGFVQTTRTNEYGYFEVTIITGRATVEVRAADYASNSTSVVIASVHSVDLQLTPANSVVQGIVYDTVTGSPVANAYIRVSSAGYSTTTTSNESGYYMVRVIAGEVTLAVSKSGYFPTSTDFTLAAGETRTYDIPIELILPESSTVSGYVLYNATPLSGVKVVVSDHAHYERSTLTDSRGYFELDIIPGHFWLDVLPAVYLVNDVEFSIVSGQRVTLDVELDAYPASTYQLDYPAGIAVDKDASGGIYQDFDSAEGLATLSFKICDSYRSNRSAGYLFTQAVMNDLVVWEDDVEGDEGWQDVQIPVMLDNGTNRVTLRVYAKQDTSYFPLTVWWDSVRLEPFDELLKETATSFSLRDLHGTEENYPTTLYLGVAAEVLAKIDNNEQRPTTYILQVRLDDEVLSSEKVFVEDGAQWEQPIAFIPDRLGALLKLEFLLFKDRVTERPYKSFTLWVSSEVDYDNLDVLTDYVVAPLPTILNADMEGSDGWSYNETEANYSGVITDVTSISPYHAFELGYPSAPCAPAGSSAALSQTFTAQSYPAAIVLSVNVKDSYTGTREGYKKQILLNDVVVWQDDVAGDERWQHLTIPVPLRSGPNTLTLRLYSTRSNCNFPISVWWDDVKIEAITAVTEKLPTSFAILDSEGTEEHYPNALYLGEPVEFIATIENNEHDRVTYELQIKLDGQVIKTKKKVLDHGSSWNESITFVSDRVGAKQQLEFLLFKNRVGKLPYRYFALPVSTELNYRDLEPLLSYSITPLPQVKDGDMSRTTGWTASTKGGLRAALASENVSRPYSYSISQFGALRAGDTGELRQEISAENDGIAVLSFTVRDTYESTSDQGKKIINQVLVNDEVVWSDDISGSDTGYVGWVEEEFVGPYWVWNDYIKTHEAFKDWEESRHDWWESDWLERNVPRVKSGWRRVDVPVYLTEGTNTLSLQVYAQQSLDELYVRVYWDDVEFKPIHELVKVDDRIRMKRYGW